MQYFLVMEVARSKRKISVFQRKYILDFLTETNILGCKPSDTPIEAWKRHENMEKQIDRKRYQRLVRKLMYLFHKGSPSWSYLQHTQISQTITRQRFVLQEKRERNLLKQIGLGSVKDKQSTNGYCTYVFGNLIT